MDLDRAELLRQAKQARRRHDNRPSIYFKFTCDHCGTRCTFTAPNILFHEGTCYECNKVTSVQKGGMLLVIHGTELSPEITENVAKGSTAEVGKPTEDELVSHVVCKNIDDFQSMVQEMKDYARAHPFNPMLAVEAAEKDPKFQTRQEGELHRITGKTQLELVKPYCRFVTLDGHTPLQIMYCHNMAGDEPLAQVALNNCNKDPLKLEEKTLVAALFMDITKPMKEIDGPPHVFVLCQLVSRKIPEPSLN